MTDTDARTLLLALAVLGLVGLFWPTPAGADFGIGPLEAGPYLSLGETQSNGGVDLALQLGTIEPDWLGIGDIAAHHAFYGDVLLAVDGDGPKGAGFGASLSLKPIADGATEDDNLRLFGAITDDWRPTFGISYRTGFSPEEWFD